MRGLREKETEIEKGKHRESRRNMHRYGHKIIVAKYALSVRVEGIELQRDRLGRYARGKGLGKKDAVLLEGHIPFRSCRRPGGT